MLGPGERIRQTANEKQRDRVSGSHAQRIRQRSGYGSIRAAAANVLTRHHDEACRIFLCQNESKMQGSAHLWPVAPAVVLLAVCSLLPSLTSHPSTMSLGTNRLCSCVSRTTLCS